MTVRTSLVGYKTLKTCVLCANDEFAQLTRAPQVNFYRCHACSVVFLNPQPTIETLKQRYSKEGIIEDGPNQAWFNHNPHYLKKLYQERLNDVMQYVERGDLLDVGCGMGDFCQVAREAGFTVFGTEFSDPYGEHTKNTIGLKEIFIGRLQEINFSHQKFDVISLWHVFEHLPDPLEVLDSARSLLKKGGLLVIEVPNVEKKKKRPMYVSDIKNCSFNEIDHLFYYSGQSLQRSCVKMNLKILGLRYVDAHQPAKHMGKYLLRKIKRQGKRILYYGRQNHGFDAFRIYLSI